MANIIQLRRDSEANWESVNPVLHDGEIGVALSCSELPTTKYKIGDGSTAWNDLGYFNDLSSYVNSAQIYSSSATTAASNASSYASTAAAQASAASNSASQAASFVGGNWPLPHSHVTGPVAVDPEYTRLSNAYDEFGKRYEYNQRRWNQNGTLIEEGTTNLLPAGAENFVTGWTNGPGETCTVTDYPINIPDIGNVIAKRIVGNGAGSTTYKYYLSIGGRPNPHTDTVSCWCQLLSGNATISLSGVSPATITGTMQRLKSTYADTANIGSCVWFMVAASTDILDIVVYAPQIENKPYATSYTPPETTRAAESLAIPVNAYQKNLLTQNQATGGDTLGNTTGFSVLTNTTVTRDTTELWNGTGSIKFVTAGIAVGEGAFCLAGASTVIGRLYTHSIYIKGTGTISLGDASQGGGINTVLTGTWQRVTHTFVATSTSAHAPFVRTAASAQAATFYIDGLQLEEGTTATDFALPAVDYTNALINPTAWTIEATVVSTLNKNNNSNIIATHYEGSDPQIFFDIRSDNKVSLQYKKASAGLQFIAGTTVIIPGVAYVIKATAGASGAKISVNGVIEATSSVPLQPVTYTSPLQIGTQQGIARQLNGSISNLRISNIARSDTEMQYTGKLLPDEYTTYYSDMKESISSRPYFKDNLGNALTLQPVNTVPATASYNASGQPTSIRAAGITHTITYNTDGSVNTIYDGIYTRTCNYSAGNLISIT